jgi:membrane protease YdiL (CAAX protease family)
VKSLKNIPVFVYVAIFGLLIYIAGAVFVIKILHDKQLYARWLWQGTVFLSILAVIAGVSWLKRINSPLKFIAYSTSTSLIILGVATITSFGLPHDYQQLVNGYVAQYDASIPVLIISLVGVVISLCLNLCMLVVIKFRKRINIDN